MPVAGSPLEYTTQTPQWGSQQTELYNRLLGQIGQIPQFNFQDYLNQAFQGPYFERVSQGLLGALQPGFARQQQQLSDMFRSSGMDTSSIYGQGMSRLMGEQSAQAGGVMANLAQSLLGTSLQAGRLGLESAMAPIQAGTALFGQLPWERTEAQSVDMNNMLTLLNAMRNQTGGGGGMDMPTFESFMQGGSGNPLLDALLQGRRTGGSMYAAAPNAGIVRGAPSEPFDWASYEASFRPSAPGVGGGQYDLGGGQQWLPYDTGQATWFDPTNYGTYDYYGGDWASMGY